MMPRSAEERLAELQERRKKSEERLARLKEQERDILKKQKEKERKDRTRRLIVCGAAMEKALGRPIDTENGEEQELAAVIAAYGKDEKMNIALSQLFSEILGREIAGSDLEKIRSFIIFQEERGKYFSRWLNKRS